MNVLSEYVYVCVVPAEVRGGLGCPGTGVREGSMPSHGC